MSRQFWTGTAASSATEEWPTPSWLANQLAEEFGPFDLDPAASASNAKAARYFTKEQDGLSQDWFGRVWMNPPYGRGIGRWASKARSEVSTGHAERVVCLIPARTDTGWWRELMPGASLVRFWPGRIAFGDGDPAPFPSAVVVLGRLPGRHGTVPAWCENCKRMFWPARSDAKFCSGKCRTAKWRG